MIFFTININHMSIVSSASYTNICHSSLTRAINLTPHDGHLHVLVNSCKQFVHGVGKLNHVHISTTAGGASDKRCAFLSQVKGLHNFETCSDFFARVVAQGDPNCIADTLIEKNTQTNGAPNTPGFGCPCLSDAQMEGASGGVYAAVSLTSIHDAPTSYKITYEPMNNSYH